MSAQSLRQWKQRTAKEAFEDVCQRLELELRIDCPKTARRHLDIYIRLAERELERIVATMDGHKDRCRARLAGLRERVMLRHLVPNRDS